MTYSEKEVSYSGMIIKLTIACVFSTELLPVNDSEWKWKVLIKMSKNCNIDDEN